MPAKRIDDSAIHLFIECVFIFLYDGSLFVVELFFCPLVRTRCDQVVKLLGHNPQAFIEPFEVKYQAVSAGVHLIVKPKPLEPGQ